MCYTHTHTHTHTHTVCPVALYTLYVIAETFRLIMMDKKLNQTQQKHAFADQKKCSKTQNKHKGTIVRLIRLSRHPARKQNGSILKKR